MEKETKKKIEQPKHDLIVALVNNGFAEAVMDAARNEGARGGTIAHARGTGNKEIEKKYGVIITPDKEAVLILVKVEIRDAVMSAINKAVGIETDGQGIVFSLPVDNVSGLKFD
ncbi:MAG: P-II family nitrogen regulator [Bacilli bacterium]|nr:P-II family nitrogen regulator [Bacilli bacterium]